MLLYFSNIDYYCNGRFSASVFSSRDVLKMATQTKLREYFGKCTLPATKQVQIVYGKDTAQSGGQ